MVARVLFRWATLILSLASMARPTGDADDLENRIVTVETHAVCDQGQRLQAVLAGD